MAAKQQFEIEGLSDCLDALEELPKATSTNVLKRTLKDAAEPFADHARSLVRYKSGALKRSIAVGTKLSRNQKSLYSKESKVEVFIGAGALVQAITEEFGTSKQTAHPFLRPAWDSGKRPALDSIKSVLANEIEKARQRLARKAERLAAKIKSGR